LVIFGRNDDVIVTGGKKVSAAEVEAALLASGEFEDVAVVGLPDAEWGQVVVACHPAGARAPRTERLARALSGLAPYKRPKRYAAISPWPRNAQGKVNRAELRILAADA
jgi:O-succinylbenzoic acid--CoA ligase